MKCIEIHVFQKRNYFCMYTVYIVDILEVYYFFLVCNIVFHPVQFLHKVEGWLLYKQINTCTVKPVLCNLPREQ